MITNPHAYLFSIILPVRNGGEYVKDCVNSILAQSISNFNLLILDSGSIDGTLEWLKTINDPRVIIYQTDKPLTIVENWARIKTINKNKWMTIIGHDDILQPHYIETMDALINHYPDASLYQTHFTLIDKKGHFIRKCKPMPVMQTAKELLNSILLNSINIYGTGYMMKSIDYDRAGGIPLYPNLLSADYVLWLKLANLSFVVTSHEYQFSYRINESTTAISSNEIYIKALDLFVNYLIDSRNILSPKEPMNSYITKILLFYCNRISRRLLLTPKSDRNGLTVSAIINGCKRKSKVLLNDESLFKPSLSIKIAKFLDSNEITRKSFLMIKKNFSNPIFQ